MVGSFWYACYLVIIPVPVDVNLNYDLCKWIKTYLPDWREKKQQGGRFGGKRIKGVIGRHEKEVAATIHRREKCDNS